MPRNDSDKYQESDDLSTKASNRPAATLLRAWGRRMAKGSAVVIPVFVGGSWSLQVPRGNKRVLRLNVPGKRKAA